MQVDAVLGGAKAINFQPTCGGKAAITGDFLVTGNEVTANQQHKAKEETMRPTHFVLVCAGLLTIVMSNAIAQEMRRGTVASIDEPGGSVTILQSPTGTVGSSGATRYGKFAVQDGLLFNALREGDKVMFTSQEINGVNTITKLQKE
jgi:Cu/Ag efflux protein CusF